VIYELREYTVVPGKLGDMVKLSGDVSRRIRGDDYGKLEGYWTSEIGPLNRLVHLWSYPSLDERARLRAALAANPAWGRDFLAKFYPQLQAQESRILTEQLPFKPPAARGHVYELRRYRVRVGGAREWIEHFRAIMPTREKYSPNVGCWLSETGALHEVTHLWAYRSLDERAEVRARVLADPEWQQFLAVAMPLLTHMESSVLAPVAFSPIG
jgi:NIPSNAP